MVYNFSVYNDKPGKVFFRTIEVDSNSLINALKLLAFEILRLGLGSDFVLWPLYKCFSSRGKSERVLSSRNLSFFEKCYRDFTDVGVIIY